MVLQPTFAVIKFLAVTLATFLLRSLSTFLLSQWAEDVDVPQRLQARRQQRYRSLLSTTHRLINVAGIGVVLFWVLLDVPGVRSASVSLLLAGGALLGALAFVFQGLLRDVSAGLVMLLEETATPSATGLRLGASKERWLRWVCSVPRSPAWING